MTRYLLDTHVVYRWMRNDRRLARELREVLARSDCTVSAASLWEMAIKSAAGKLPLPAGSLVDSVEGQGFPVLSISGRHVEATRRFDAALGDPFDRLLLATAAAEGMLLLTQDASILELANVARLPVARIA
jgi:PIN domain nuclease of toxin-antitoxin system